MRRRAARAPSASRSTAAPTPTRPSTESSLLPASFDRLIADVADDALVLDVGGWAKPLARADWVLDLQPHATRGDYGYLGDPASERFTTETWVQRDICDREPWPFADGRFDFAVCSHTLEDVRDPVWVCEELVRVAKAGYVEVPSRLEEQTWGVTGPWAGWAPHRWLCDVDPCAPRIEFVFKSPAVHLPSRCLPEAFRRGLPPERRVQWFWWEGSFAFAER